MSEMIIPGTYITVRAEGLITAGRVATGIVAVLGTADSGPIGEPVMLSGFANAREIFGPPDSYTNPEDGSTPLTLIRALEHVYNNGASTVIGVRVAGSSAESATFAVLDDQNRKITTFTARSPGTAGNKMHVQVTPATEPCRIEREAYTDSFDRLTYAPVLPSAQNQIRIYRGQSRRTDIMSIVYKRVVKDERVLPNSGGRFFLANTPVVDVADVNHVRVLASDDSLVREFGQGDILIGAGAPPAAGEIRIANNADNSEIIFEAGQVPDATQRIVATYAVDHAPPQPGEVLITAWDGKLTFAQNEAPKQANGDQITATYLVDPAACVQVSLMAGQIVERYTVPDGRILAARINQSSRLATVDASGAHAARRPALSGDMYFGVGSNTTGSNGADAGPSDYAAGLESIATTMVNIVVLAGQDATTLGSVLAGHLNSTAQTDFERIGVIGAAGSDVASFLGHNVSSDRIILVAPGIRYPDGTVLPPAYTAAAVAGLLASLPVHNSVTNKAVNIPSPAIRFNRGQQEQLITSNVLAIIERDGFRVLKGVTTAGQGTPFAQITTRRIVDYAKYGVRSASNPYIGRLNNARVRAALKSTLDAFLTRMVDDEALTGYELDVTAIRAQEIEGVVSVTMVLRPTFSIDYIRVVMNLQ